MMTLTIIFAEISLVLLIVVSVITLKALQRRRRDQDAVNTLVISIKANQPARVEKLAGMLKDNADLSEDDALNKANELIKKKNKFYQDAIDLYFTRNNEVLSKLDNRLEDLLDQYQALLKVTGAGNEGVDSEAMEQFSKDIAALSKEIEELRSENTTLSDQLKAAEQELDQLGREYVSAFNRPKTDKAKGEKVESSAHEEEKQGNEVEAEQAVEENEPATGKNMHTNEDGPATKAEQRDEETPTLTAESAVKETEMPKAEVSTPAPETNNTKEDANNDVNVSFMDESSDQNLFADLGLDELIGDQPGRQAVGGGANSKK